jgi:hypothetical protein
MPRQKNNSSHEPSDKEICRKIDEAILAIDSPDSAPQIIDERHTKLAYRFLGCSDLDTLFDWVATFLHEIKSIGPIVCFAGTAGRYVQRCDHPGYNDIFLYPYAFDSPSLGEIVYLKFGIRKSETEGTMTFTYMHLDCHENRPRT